MNKSEDLLNVSSTGKGGKEYVVKVNKETVTDFAEWGGQVVKDAIPQLGAGFAAAAVGKVVTQTTTQLPPLQRASVIAGLTAFSVWIAAGGNLGKQSTSNKSHIADMKNEFLKRRDEHNNAVLRSEACLQNTVISNNNNNSFPLPEPAEQIESNSPVLSASLLR
uniref:Uncharacterized protein n=1 Tax=Phanerochaete carnosa TaxID=231932 RepID=A0A895KSZ7_9APHY|nr:hypothetical protein K8K84_mgp086 [Phanerochaete carnosa]QRZ60366.1 hypothetical protein [Phanerochaete carnosa]